MSQSRRRLFTECLEARDVPNANLTGRTFEDTNLDGFYDQITRYANVCAPPPEYGVAGVTVELDLGGDGTYEQTTTSDAAGEYRFTDVPDTGIFGIHKIRVSKAGFVSTTFSPNSFSVMNGEVSTLVNRLVVFPDFPGRLLELPRFSNNPLFFGLVRAGGWAGSPAARSTSIRTATENFPELIPASDETSKAFPTTAQVSTFSMPHRNG